MNDKWGKVQLMHLDPDPFIDTLHKWVAVFRLDPYGPRWRGKGQSSPVARSTFHLPRPCEKIIHVFSIGKTWGEKPKPVGRGEDNLKELGLILPIIHDDNQMPMQSSASTE